MPQSRAVKLLLKKYRSSFKRYQRQIKKLPRNNLFIKRYILFSWAILAGTTIYWSILGARLQTANADQLIDPYLFKNLTTLHSATFPSAHSFLIKWPIFWLINLFGNSSAAYQFFTVLCVLATVLCLALVVRRIEKRPIIYSTIFLGLASVLLMVPPLPSGTTLLPVNMAMLATRNLEYALYILSIVIVIKSRRNRSRGFWLATILLGLLIASDKLFLELSIGAGLILFLVSAWRRRTLSARWLDWLGVSLLASALAIALLWFINDSGLTHISAQASASPYGLSFSPHNLGLGIIYLILGFFTNLGANPAFSATELKNIPHDLFSNLFNVGGPAYVVNFCLTLFGLLAIYKLVALKGTDKRVNRPYFLSMILIASSLVAFAAYVLTNHYYAVDARYLAIVVFALFIAGATYLSYQKRIKAQMFLVAGGLITISICFAVANSFRTYHNDQAALSEFNSRNSSVAHILQNHPVNALLGDYWRVVPIKQQSSTLNVVPLADCTNARNLLTSTSWQPNLKTKSFAYLISYDLNLTGFSSCSLDQIVSIYGKPSSSVLIAGTIGHPKEQLLFYNHGINKKPTRKYNYANPPLTTNGVNPAPIGRLMNYRCQGITVMNIVAHQDDDLLFMNPDLLHYIQAGDCVRTIYVTAGDSGNDSFYWLGREQGSEAAYSVMAGLKDQTWIERNIQINNHEYVTFAHPEDVPKISLVFMHLPDGNLQGQGFLASGFESLEKLEIGRIASIQTVDGQSTYTANDLTAALTSLINVFKPSLINTQAHYVGRQFPDHDDHMAVGRFVEKANTAYNSQVPIPLKEYIGYPIHNFAPNVSGTDLTAKEQVFLAYASHDGSVCHSLAQCLQDPAYGAYLTRQYQY